MELAIGDCEECGGLVDALVRLGVSEDRRGVYVCQECLLKALALFSPPEVE
jgi:hypothetical protein